MSENTAGGGGLTCSLWCCCPAVWQETSAPPCLVRSNKPDLPRRSETRGREEAAGGPSPCGRRLSPPASVCKQTPQQPWVGLRPPETGDSERPQVRHSNREVEVWEHYRLLWIQLIPAEITIYFIYLLVGNGSGSQTASLKTLNNLKL